MCRSRLSYFNAQPNIATEYRAAASLHSHTHHSKESLQFIPQFAEKYPLLKWALDRWCKTAAIRVDFERAYWTPPLNAEMSLRVEKDQIEQKLGRASFVSLTDHDTIEAPLLLRAMPETKDVPISLEWSAPYGGTLFHFGIHNLPDKCAQSSVANLAHYTKNPSEKELYQLLAALNEFPDVLVVFNHPLWDQCEVGQNLHEQAVRQFMETGGQFVHAVEINATRVWSENDRAREMAEQWKLPSVAGGDRHGCDPSSALNLTNANSFSELVNEIRYAQRSHVLMMPQYDEPRCILIMQMLLDVIREYPEHPFGSRRWDNRVFHPGRKTPEDTPVSNLWGRPPVFLEILFSSLRLLEYTAVKNALKQAMPRETMERVATDVSYEASS